MQHSTDPPVEALLTPREAAKLLGVSERTLWSLSARGMIPPVQRDLIPKNPFDHLPSGTTATTNERYVTPDEAARVLAACDDPACRMTYALARFAGLRVPSETHGLTWADVDFGRGRLTVRSPKTERHAGHDRRTVPVGPAMTGVL